MAKGSKRRRGVSQRKAPAGGRRRRAPADVSAGSGESAERLSGRKRGDGLGKQSGGHGVGSRGGKGGDSSASSLEGWPGVGRPGRGWYSRQELAALLEVSLQHFERHYQPLLGAPAESGPYGPGVSVVVEKRGRAGAKLWIRGRALVDAVAERVAAQQTAALRELIGERDPDGLLMAVGAGGWAEAFRKVKTLRERLKYELEREELIHRETLRDGLERFATALRGAGTRLQDRFGPEAQGLFDEGLEEALRVVRDAFGEGEVTAKAVGE